MWNRILGSEELTSLAECNATVRRGVVFSWSDAKPLWHLSNVRIEEIEEDKDIVLCGKSGDFTILTNIPTLNRTDQIIFKK